MDETKIVEEKSEKKITPRQEDYSKWYHDVVAAADLAENAPVKGCMTIKPSGYAIWEIIQQTIDQMFKAKGIENAYFPLFIPESYMQREAEHVAGFSPELAVVTHAGGKKLEEPLVVRPTSETIIYEAFSRWIHSHRDLPLTINQWANVVRWELRPRLFLRTTEFLWQEGHTAHASAGEAQDYARMILNDVYRAFAEDYLAIPVYLGKKSDSEKFAGAKQTFCIEALMQDGKSLQAGTSHDLGDNFAKSFNVTFLDQEGQSKFVFSSCWGVSTRLIGGLIMAHSDDKGLVLPPKVAPVQVVVVPINAEKDEQVMAKAKEIVGMISDVARVKLDDREHVRIGEKFYEWEKKGVPLRIEIGPKELVANQCILVCRDTGEKETVGLEGLDNRIAQVLGEMQKSLYEQALERREKSNHMVDNWDDFKQAVDAGGYIFAYWCENATCEAEIKAETKATTRCLPFDEEKDNASNGESEHKCVKCGQPSKSNKRWIFARAY